MPNYFGIAFVGVLACAGLGLEYHRQSVKAGVPMTQLAPAQFVSAVSADINMAVAARADQAQQMQRDAARKGEMRRHLPDAPEGWTRLGFDEADHTAVLPEGRPVPAYGKKHPMHDFVFEALAGTRTHDKIVDLQRKRESADEVMQEHHAGSSYVYTKGDETVLIEALLKTAPAEKLTGSKAKARRMAIMAKLAKAPEAPRPFAVVAGVPIYEARGKDGGMLGHYRILYAQIGLGEEVRLRIHANASSASTREMLAAVDFEALNALLPVPMTHVRNASPQLSLQGEGIYASVANTFRVLGTTSLISHEVQMLRPVGGSAKPDALVRKYGHDLTVAQMLALRHRDSMRSLADVDDLARDIGTLHALYDDALKTDAPYDTSVPEQAADAGSLAVPGGSAQEDGAAPEMSAALKSELAGHAAPLVAAAVPALAPERPRQAGALGAGSAPKRVVKTAPAKASKPKVKVNRLSGGSKPSVRRAGGCGGTGFCKVSK